MIKLILGFAVFAVIMGSSVAPAIALSEPIEGQCDDPAGPGVDWSGCDKSGQDLFGANLSGANLSGADLSDGDLLDANLSNANLTNAVLSNADLLSAVLSNADLLYADLSNADLFNATLTFANLEGADLSDADLSYADLEGADLSNADLSNADLSNANLKKTVLSNTNLSNANLYKADYDKRDLLHANTTGAYIPNEEPEDPNLVWIDFDGDGLSNIEEKGRTSIHNGDSDNDDLSDYQEEKITLTNSTNSDSDGDGMSDGNELALGFNPLDSNSPFKKIEYDTAFDWSMPERFGLTKSFVKFGYTYDYTVIDYFETETNVNFIAKVGGKNMPITPEFWRVDFSACSLAKSDPETEFEWLVDENSVEVNSKCDGFSHNFPYEGSYKVTLKIKNPNHQQKIYTENVIVQDFLIFSFGDSYGSGEGVPDVSLNGVYVANQIKEIRLLGDKIRKERDEIRDIRWELLDDRKELWHDFGLKMVQLYNQLGEKENRCDNLLDKMKKKHKQIDNKKKQKVDAGPVKKASLNVILKVLNTQLQRLDNTLERLECGKILEECAICDTKDDMKKLRDHKKELQKEKIILRMNIINDLRQKFKVTEDLLTRYSIAPEWHSGDKARTIDNQIIRDLLEEVWYPKILEVDVIDRSANSGHAKAALWLEKSDPRTSVTFVHLANSGAVTEDIIFQIQEVNLANSTNREIDAVILSIGGNDAYFGTIVTKCMKPKDDCTTDAKELFHSAIYGYKGNDETEICSEYEKYGDGTCNQLENNFEVNVKNQLMKLNGLKSNGPEETVRFDRVYHMEYGDATKDENGDHCGDSNPLGPRGISHDEYIWLDTTFLTQTNEQIKEASKKYEWNYVTGIFDKSRNHGICSKEPWIVGLAESWIVQRGIAGAFHPNSPGYANYGYAILKDLKKDLYIDGVPRTPDYDTSAGAPEQVDTTDDSIVDTTEITVPAWMKGPVGFWADDLTTDDEFRDSIQFMIKEKLIVVPPTEVSDTQAETEIPEWIKGMAGFWSEGKTSDEEFVNGLTFLIEKGIIVVGT